MSSAPVQYPSLGDVALKISQVGVPIIAIILMGFLMAMFKAFPTQQALPWINKFVFYVAIPCTVFKGLATQDFIRDKTWDWVFIGAFLLLRVFVGIIVFLYTWLYQKYANKDQGVASMETQAARKSSDYRDDWMGAFLVDWISETYLNTLIFGIPVLQSIYGAAALLLNVLASLSALFFQLPVLLLFFEWRKARLVATEQTEKSEMSEGSEQSGEQVLTAGVAFEKNLTWGQKTWYLMKLGFMGCVKNPPIWGIVLGLIYSLAITSTTNAITVDASGKHVFPMQLDIMVTWLGDTVTPLASFCIGLFAYQSWRSFVKPSSLLRNFLLLIGKFILVPILMIGIVFMLGMTSQPGTAWKGRVAVLIAQMPVALAGFTLCAQYGVSGREVVAFQIAIGTILMCGTTIAWDAIMQQMGLFGADIKRLQY